MKQTNSYVTITSQGGIEHEKDTKKEMRFVIIIDGNTIYLVYS